MEQIGSHRCFGGQQLRFTHRSATLDCEMCFSLYLPPQSEYAPVPLQHWLSGLTCTDENFVIKGGAMPGAVISANEVKALANMPSRDQLIAQLMGTMRAPIQKFVSTLNEVPSRFVRTVAAVRDAKEKAGA